MALKGVGVEGYKLYRRVPSRQLPINFFRHFCCRMYRLATKRSQPPKVFHSLEYKSKMHAAHCIASGHSLRTESTSDVNRHYKQTISSTIGLLSDRYAFVIATCWNWKMKWNNTFEISLYTSPLSLQQYFQSSYLDQNILVTAPLVPALATALTRNYNVGA